MPALNIDRADFLKEEDIVIFSRLGRPVPRRARARIPGGEMA